VLGSASAASTTFTMPQGNVEVQAIWKALPIPPAYYDVTVNGSYSATTGAGAYLAAETVGIDAGTRSGYDFKGWTVNSGAAVLADSNAAATTFVMPAGNVTVTATWEAVVVPPAYFTVTVNGSHAATTGAGSYLAGATVTIDAGTWDGYVFNSWTVVSGGAVLANASAVSTTFAMPADNVTVQASWILVEPLPPYYNVTVTGSHSATAGDGAYFVGDTVSIDAGTWEGYEFKGWTVVSGTAVLADAAAASTTFVMPPDNVIVTATWEAAATPKPLVPAVGDTTGILAALALVLLGLSSTVFVVSRRKI